MACLICYLSLGHLKTFERTNRNRPQTTNMKMSIFSLVAFSLLCCVALSTPETTANDSNLERSLLDAVLQRLAVLEARDDETQERIQLLESEVAELKADTVKCQEETSSLDLDQKQHVIDNGHVQFGDYGNIKRGKYVS